MFSLFKAKNRPLIGLDIHSEEICLLQLKSHKKNISIEKYAFVELPADVVIDGKIKQADMLSDEIGKLMRSAEVGRQPVAIALPSNSVITKRITLPANLTNEEYEAEIATNLRTYFPGLSEELCFDFTVEGVKDDEQVDVLLIAARQAQVQEYIAVVNDAGLSVNIVDVDSYALLRAANICLPMITPPVVAVLTIHWVSAQFVVFQNQQIIFNQQIVLTDASSEKFFLELIAQLRRALQMCATLHGSVSIAEIILAGKMAVLTQLAPIIQEELLMQTLIVNPFESLVTNNKIELAKQATRMLVSYGLALRGVE